MNAHLDKTLQNHLSLLSNGSVNVSSVDLASQWRTVRGVLDIMTNFDVPAARIREFLSKTGLPETALRDPDFPVSISQEWEIIADLCELFSETVGNPLRIFQILHTWDITSMGLLGLAMKYAPSVGEALQLNATYPHLSWARCRVQTEIDSRSTRLRYDVGRDSIPNASEPVFRKVSHLAKSIDLISTQRMVADISRGKLIARKIYFQQPKPIDWPARDVSIPCEIEFEHSWSGVEWSGNIANHTNSQFNKIAYTTFVNALERSAAEHQSVMKLSDIVRRWLWSTLPPPSKQEMSKLVHMSQRNFSRKLAIEGATYRELVSSVQYERTRNLLANTDKTISQIAWQLGYSEPQSLVLAFKKRAGSTPHRWRKENAR